MDPWSMFCPHPFHRGLGSQVGKVTRSGGVKKKNHTYNSAIPVCIFSRLLNCRLARKQPQPEQQQKKRLVFNALLLSIAALVLKSFNLSCLALSMMQSHCQSRLVVQSTNLM